MGYKLIKPIASSIPRMPFYYETFIARNFSTSPLTISGLKGDIYDYTLFIQSDDVGSNGLWHIRCNGDSGANYRSYTIQGSSSTASSAITDSATELRGGSTAYVRTSGSNLFFMKITGSSGNERYFDCMAAGYNTIVNKNSGYWKNTASELTSIEIKTSVSTTADATIAMFATPKDTSSENWTLIDEHTLSSVNVNSSPDSFTGLSLDSDGEYLYEFDLTEANSIDLGIRFNSDSATNYLGQELQNGGGSISSQTRSSFANIFINDTGSSAAVKGHYIIKGDSASKRIAVGSHGQTAKAFQQISECWWWNNTVDDLDEISLVSHTGSASSTSGTIKLYKKKNPNTVSDYFRLPFKILKKHDVSGDFSAGHTFSGLNGDSVLMYKLEWFGDLASAGTMLYQINGDTGGNYDYQRLQASGSSASATSASSQTSQEMVAPYNSNPGYACLYIFPKSGEKRPALNFRGEQGSVIMFNAHWWNNTADEITSIKIYGNNTASYTGKLKLSYIPLSET